MNGLEFSWFVRQFPKQKLTVINKKNFQSDWITGITLSEVTDNAETNAETTS